MMTEIKYKHIAPLAILRIAFGAVMFISTIRFIMKGWVHDFYIVPRFHFPFYGFEWVHPLPPAGMYAVYGCMAAGALFMSLGLFFRPATATFLLCFVYAELLDKTYYLNHYYLVSLLAFLLLLTPANRNYSLDVWRNRSLRVTHVPAWAINIFKIQLCIVYCYAGLSKLTYDWLINAMPLKLWLHAKDSTPFIGPLFHYSWTPYFFSWTGALFDLSIPFFLMGKHTRKWAYAVVIIFHMLTAMLFQIGMFPYIMMTATTIFFPFEKNAPVVQLHIQNNRQKLIYGVLTVYFVLQLLIPIRFLLYPGHLLWTEEGYRFSWRVMLMEKGGTTFFYIRNPATGRKFQVNNARFLTGYQERMMETQPDMILQYAHILHNTYEQQGVPDPEVTVASYVTLNGQGSRLYIDSTVNLAREKEPWLRHKPWIMPYIKNN